MSTLLDLPTLTTATTAITGPSPSPSMSSIDTSSDDAPQLSFEYIWGDDGKFQRISKRSPADVHGELVHITAEDNDATAESQGTPKTHHNTTTNTDTHAHLHEVLGNDRTAENAQSIASVLALSSSASVIPQHPPGSSRPFSRAVSGPAATPGGYVSTLLGVPGVAERPFVRARRVPLEEKRKEEAQMARKDKEEGEREKELRRMRMREMEKENWGLSIGESSGKDQPANPHLSSSLTRTQSDPYPSALFPQEQPPEHQSQPLSTDPVAYRSRRPLSKQQRVLSGVPRALDVLGPPRPTTKDAARPSGGSSGSSTPEDARPPRPASRTTGGARRITKEERERQEREAEREAAELQAQLERQQREAREREEERERALEQEREVQRIIEREEEEKRLEAEAQAQRERHTRPPSRQLESEEREHERFADRPRPTGTHQRRESETVMPEAPAVPARLSPSARHIAHREERILGSSQTREPPGLSSSNPSRPQHRRSPTAPEAHTRASTNGAQPSGAKGKTWAQGVEVIGEVDRDLGGLGPQDENGVRERDPRAPPPPVQVNGAKNFTVNGKMYGKLDMIGKGGSSRVYRVITPSNEIYALKRVSLDRTDQETMQGYMNEIALLRRLDGNERVIRLVESEVRGGSKGHLMLVMECGEVDLARLIAAKQSSALDMVWVAYYWKQMLEAVHVIHEEKIVHSDLKPANFVLVKGELKLIDFGIANAIANDTTNIQRDHQIGTVNYMSPESIEVLEGNTRLKVGRPSDVWSLGCILYQMVYGTPPFHQLSVLQKMRAIPDPNNVIEFPDQAVPIVPQPRTTPSASGGGGSAPPKKLYHLAKPVPPEVIKSLKSCLRKNPKERETIPQFLDAGWLHPKGESENIVLSEDEVVIDTDLLRQVVSWAIRVGETTGMPKIPEEFQETLEQTFIQLKSCSRRR